MTNRNLKRSAAKINRSEKRTVDVTRKIGGKINRKENLAVIEKI
jgi:hypothetical protein